MMGVCYRVIAIEDFRDTELPAILPVWASISFFMKAYDIAYFFDYVLRI